ncbi:MAG: hypothetical protein KC493_14255 [Bacteriovoracaceae bacterium]|nr:hypothetical protein [Bacteriovoracaceae bacterium]
MKNLALISISFLLSFPIFAGDSRFSVSFGPVRIGESRVKADLADFKIEQEFKNRLIKASFIKSSIQWVRDDHNLLTPRARLGILIYKTNSNIHLEYHGRVIIPQKQGKYHYIEIYINLFDPGVLKIVEDNTVIEKLHTYTDISDKTKNTKMVDFSCVRYGLKITGLNDEYVSVGCRIERTGVWGQEKPYLAVTWSATNIELVNGKTPPFKTFLKNNEPVIFTVRDQEGRNKKVTLKARLPKRMNRVKTAYGFGPAGLLGETPTEKHDWKIAPVLYLYGKLELSPYTSVRVFDALAINKSIFNNSGFYFAYRLADALDGQFEIVPLLGAQGLYFKYDKDGNQKTQNGMIFPQGAELNYKNAFGVENYLISFGIFLSTQSDVDYTNTWVRWGKGPFWEFNYITWGQNGYVSKMAGLSIGLPLANFF